MIYYIFCAVASFGLSIAYLLLKDRNENSYFAVVSVLIPIINLGYLASATAMNHEQALLANCISYLDGCFMQPIYLLFVLDFCKIKLKKLPVCILTVISFVVYLSVLTNSYHHLFYKETTFVHYKDISYLVKVGGPIHTAYYVYVIGCIFVGCAILSYGIRKKNVSTTYIILLMGVYLIDLLSFFIGKFLTAGFEILPLIYVLDQAAFIFMFQNIWIYDVRRNASKAFAEYSGMGVVCFNLREEFVGCNEPASSYFSELGELSVDHRIKSDTGVLKMLATGLVSMRIKNKPDPMTWQVDQKTYKISPEYIFNNGRIGGYQFIIQDDTRNQSFLELINNYNRSLTEDVEIKTEQIKAEHLQFITGLAEMIESRDNTTGGHVKRTAEAVKIILDEMSKDVRSGISMTFCDHLITAAPLHDIGKIAVDDEILRKPGKYSELEYSIMKTHAPKGVELVRKVFSGIQDPDLIRVVENTVHYHHERFDGTGYPDGLSGEAIPLEARIMAIADVYDALVSKRCYKEAMPFDKAYHIIDDGMGTQFDPHLRKYFAAARERLEEYYAANTGV